MRLMFKTMFVKLNNKLMKHHLRQLLPPFLHVSISTSSPPPHPLSFPVLNYGACDWSRITESCSQSGAVLRWPLTPSGGACVRLPARVLMNVCVCVYVRGWRARFKTIRDPVVRAVWQKGHRDGVHQEPPLHTHTHTLRWTCCLSGVHIWICRHPRWDDNHR